MRVQVPAQPASSRPSPSRNPHREEARIAHRSLLAWLRALPLEEQDAEKLRGHLPFPLSEPKEGWKQYAQNLRAVREQIASQYREKALSEVEKLLAQVAELESFLSRRSEVEVSLSPELTELKGSLRNASSSLQRARQVGPESASFALAVQSARGELLRAFRLAERQTGLRDVAVQLGSGAASAGKALAAAAVAAPAAVVSAVESSPKWLAAGLAVAVGAYLLLRGR